jgi:hypothetical protein
MGAEIECKVSRSGEQGVELPQAALPSRYAVINH